MKPINVARFVRVFSILAVFTLALEVKLGHFDDSMWVFPVVALMLLFTMITTTQLIHDYKQQDKPPR